MNDAQKHNNCSYSDVGLKNSEKNKKQISVSVSARENMLCLVLSKK
jgi:hypothetical protein